MSKMRIMKGMVILFKVEVVASASRGRGKNRLQILECHLKDKTGSEVSYKYIDAQLFKDKGIIKKFPGFKAVEEYLNTEEGMKFYHETPHVPF